MGRIHNVEEFVSYKIRYNGSRRG